MKCELSNETMKFDDNHNISTQSKWTNESAYCWQVRPKKAKHQKLAYLHDGLCENHNHYCLANFNNENFNPVCLRVNAVYDIMCYYIKYNILCEYRPHLLFAQESARHDAL